jgi:hypothetical protein
MAVSGCAANDGPDPGDPPKASRAAQPSVTASPSAITELSIAFDDGSGTAASWRLTCAPAGGAHPDPEAACDALEANGARSLPATAKSRMCSQKYGGPETAVVTGTWRGKVVRSQLNLTNSCEISRWNALKGLLPASGS